jgi:porphobilinogen synthase
MTMDKSSPGFPKVRLRRLRKNLAIRQLLQETRISAKDFIYPIFVKEGISAVEESKAMAGVRKFPLSGLIEEVQGCYDIGIRAFIIFGIPSSKDESGSSSFNRHGIVQQSIESLRSAFGDRIVVISDVCLCQYTLSGHCGILKGSRVDNDQSLNLLAKIALSHAISGSDMVAPSAMMDGQVMAIREALDNSGFTDTIIMGYSAKHASSLYSPFREISDSSPSLGDRKTYQMSFLNHREALREVMLDIQEGADIIMVKPAVPYLDLIRRVREMTNLPLCAFSVSGDYAMIKAASTKGLIDEKQAVHEMLSSIKRAGADIIITYHAKLISQVLNSE